MRRIARFFALLMISAAVGGGALAQPAEETIAEALLRALEEAARGGEGEGCVDRVCPENRSETVLPNAALGDYLEALPEDATAAEPSAAAVKVTSVSSDSVFRDQVEGSITAGEGGFNQPLQDACRLLIMFRPTLTPAEAAQALSDYGLKVVRTLPLIGAVSVDGSAAIERYYGYTPASAAAATTLDKVSKSPVYRLVRRLRRDNRFIAVTVDAVLTGAQIATVVKARPSSAPGIGAGGGITAASERSNWGMASAKISPLWPLLTQTVTVGVLDDGFADHEDLPMEQGSDVAWRREDHGNHVAGIMCARHDNGVGIKGVLPKCKVKAAVATIEVPDAATTGDSGVEVEDRIDNITTLLAEYVGAVLMFMETNPDAKVINLSLSYNWMPNFGIDPRAKKFKRIRKEVENQGIFIRAILAVAKTRDIVIFSAAGNDSTDLATPLPAKWASPFNYGSLQIERLDGWTNGIIVESHTETLKRSDFSNVDGHISCPGSDILSALSLSRRSYGVMSGTSMASPYCAASFAALRSLKPDLSVRQALACFLNPPETVAGTPRMNLEAAFEACRNVQP